MATPMINETEETFYKTLTSRNFHFITKNTQESLSKLNVMIAGCGSTGGACIEALTRAGVKNFKLADNGTYELSNLNRQHARQNAIGKNKAVFHSEEVRGINPYADVTVFNEGLTPNNLKAALKGIELVIDAIDVTSTSGMEMKIRLHDLCATLALPVFTALDLGYRQWGMSFDYRSGDLAPLRGKAEIARSKSHPISALFTLYPLSALPDHALPFVEDLLENRIDYASQLGATSDLLSSVIVAATIRFVETGELVEGWSLDLWSIKEGKRGTLISRLHARLGAQRIRKKIRNGIERDLYILPQT